VSHVKPHFQTTAPLLYDAATRISLMATPTFLLLSGFVAAYVLRSDPTRRSAVTLVDRGLFLLLVAHVLLGFTEFESVTLFQWLFVRTTITDAIGIALCVAVLLRNRSAGMLLALGASIFILSWVIGATLAVESVWAKHLATLLFSVRSGPERLVDVALAPYLGLFLVGMGLSTYMKDQIAAGDNRALARRLLIIGGASVSLIVAIALAWRFFKEGLPEALREPHNMQLLRITINPTTKWPPSPGYLLFYGGAGLLMAGWYFYGRPAQLVKPLVAKASVIGRASLMCFVLQDWLLIVTPAVLGFSDITSPVFWIAYLVAAVLALYVVAGAWDRVRGNRFLTIGLKRLMLGPAQQRRRAMADGARDTAASR